MQHLLKYGSARANIHTALYDDDNGTYKHPSYKKLKNSRVFIKTTKKTTTTTTTTESKYLLYFSSSYFMYISAVNLKLMLMKQLKILGGRVRERADESAHKVAKS